MLMGLVSAALLASETSFRALAMVCLGLCFGLVGMDVNSGAMRFTFDVIELTDGLSLVAIAVGLFGLPEIMTTVGTASLQSGGGKLGLREMMPRRSEWRAVVPSMLRGSGVGAFFGILPGTGAVTASFMAYAVEKKSSATPERFGKGAIEGVVAPEAASNAAAQSSFIPTLSLGIPGDPIMALMLGVMMVHNILPGPNFITGQPELFWGLVASFLVGNIMLVVLNVPMIGLWVKLLKVPYRVLFPIIIALCCIGVYSVNYQVIDLFVLIGFGVLGLLLKRLNFPPAPLLLGLVLGPMLEENFRRGMVIEDGNFASFFTRPVSALFLGLIVVILCWTLFTTLRGRRRHG